LETQAGREAYAHVKAGDVDAYSFGFNAIADHVENGIRAITEVRLWECGPVIFEANAQARIVDVRAIDAPNTERPVIENELARATSDYIMEKWDGNVDEMAKNTGWTSEEIKQLRRGEILPAESRAKLADLPDTIHRAHQTLRSKAVQTLCDELRQGGLNDAERARVMGLLGLGDDWGSRMSSAVNTVRTLRESLRQSNVR
jgi:hypothetical protein